MEITHLFCRADANKNASVSFEVWNIHSPGRPDNVVVKQINI